VFIRDLILIKETAKDSSGLIDLTKVAKIAKVLMAIKRYQDEGYQEKGWDNVPGLDDWIDNEMSEGRSEDLLYRMSKEVEPGQISSEWRRRIP
jgi:hypothetical protein